jgi:hypothetical protein
MPTLLLLVKHGAISLIPFFHYICLFIFVHLHLILHHHSHDRPFAMNLHATHVAYVNQGSVTLEQRGLRESDWRDDAASSLDDDEDGPEGQGHKGTASADGCSSASSSSGNNCELDPKALAELRQVAFKKRSALPKLEAKIEKAEGEVSDES